LQGGAGPQSLLVLGSDPLRGTTSSGSAITGLGLFAFPQNGITIFPSSTNNYIVSNYIGFGPRNGQTLRTTDVFPASSSFTVGIGVQSTGNYIADNTISGLYNGIAMGGTQGVDFNAVLGNRIGTDPTGTTAAGYGNLANGVFLGSNAQANFIGPGNVISGNAFAGVFLSSSTAAFNAVFGNRIGTNAAGSGVVGNGFGVLLDGGAGGNTVGGPLGCNLISGNSQGGVMLGLSPSSPAVSNLVQFNFIGMNAAQTQALGSQAVGVSVSSGSALNAVFSNVVAGNSGNGLQMASASDNAVQGNSFGQSYNAVGVAFGNQVQIANAGFGVALMPGASFNFVGLNGYGSNNLGTLFVSPSAVGNSLF
jgi:hypothetical protein